jgi:hypothetical protein
MKKEKVSTQRTQRQSTEFTEKRKAPASEGGRYKGNEVEGQSARG